MNARLFSGLFVFSIAVGALLGVAYPLNHASATEQCANQDQPRRKLGAG